MQNGSLRKWLEYVNVRSLFTFVFLILFHCEGFSYDGSPLPQQWSSLDEIIISRQNQVKLKMKLNKNQVESLNIYLKSLAPDDLFQLQKLQETLPKTTLELLFAIKLRGLSKREAEKIAIYLQKMPSIYHNSFR